MHTTKPQHYFLVFLIAVTGILSFFIFKPFLGTLALAATFAVVFHPLFLKLLAKFKGSRALASLLSIVLVACILIIPLTLIGARIVQEASSLYSSMIVSADSGTLTGWFTKISDDLATYVPSLKDASFDVRGYLEQGLALLLKNAVPLFSNLVALFLHSFIFLMALYFLLKEGDALTENIIRLSPLSDADDKAILESLRQAVHSVVTGNLLTALIQGCVATVGFMIFGIPNAILFGAVTSVAALLPGLGTSLVILPAVLFLAATGHLGGAIGLFVWGMLAVGLVDNFLAPRLVGRGMRMHPVIVFLSVIGGLSFFGPFGFIFGPLIVGLFYTLTEFLFTKKYA